MNHSRIPCKEPRIRLEVSNEADPIRNIGNCQTPQRTRSSSRLPRNESQNAATGTSDSLTNMTDIEIVSDIVEGFKEISEPNTSANPKKETGGLFFRRRLENRFIINTLLIPKQNGYDTYFETASEYEISNFFNSDPDLILLGIIHTHPGFDAFLSSIDLHMFHRYTLDNLSVISIVLALSLTNTGVLCLNSCKRDIHRQHRHNRTALYRLAKHVKYINNVYISRRPEKNVVNNSYLC